MQTKLLCKRVGSVTTSDQPGTDPAQQAAPATPGAAVHCEGKQAEADNLAAL